MKEVKDLEIGMTVKISEIWDGEFGDIDEILESGTVSPDEENVVAFDILKNDGIDSVIKITDIY